MTKTYVLLGLLENVTYESETAADNAKWLKNIERNFANGGYTYENAEDYTCAEFEDAEMQAVQGVDVYNMIGGENEQESLYLRDIEVFKNVASSEYYVLYDEELCEF